MKTAILSTLLIGSLADEYPNPKMPDYDHQVHESQQGSEFFEYINSNKASELALTEKSFDALVIDERT